MSTCVYVHPHVCVHLYMFACMGYIHVCVGMSVGVSKFILPHRHTVTHHAFVFINEKARNSWVEQFTESKKMAEGTIFLHKQYTYLYCM